MTDQKEGYGQLQPPQVQTEFGRISFVVRQMMARLRTVTPVQIKAVHTTGGLAAAGTVDVIPMISMLDGNGNATPHGKVNGVPYFRLQGGVNAVIIDPVVGDIGFVVVSDRDMSSVKSAKKVANPGSLRQHDLSDGIYIGGILNATPTQYVLFADSGVTIADKNGNTLVSSNTGWALTGNLKVTGTVEATALETADGNLIVKGTLDVKGATTLESATTLLTTLDVKGATTLESTASITGVITAGATMNLTGNVNISGNYQGNDFFPIGRAAYSNHFHVYQLTGGPSAPTDTTGPN